MSSIFFARHAHIHTLHWFKIKSRPLPGFQMFPHFPTNFAVGAWDHPNSTTVASVGCSYPRGPRSWMILFDYSCLQHLKTKRIFHVWYGFGFSMIFPPAWSCRRAGIAGRFDSVLNEWRTRKLMQLQLG